MSKLTLTQVASAYESTQAINANYSLIEAALENTISRDGTNPNYMNHNFDMNGFNILNQGNPITVEGLVWEGPWLTSVLYEVGDIVEEGGTAYICIVEHTSAVFATDVSSLFWQIFTQANLPSQTGKGDKVLRTDGFTASWEDSVLVYDNVSLMQAESLAIGSLVKTNGYYSAGDKGAAEYLIVAPQSFDSFGDHELANSNVAILQVEGVVNVKQFGAKGDGTTDAAPAIQAALDANDTVYLPEGDYLVQTAITMPKGSILYGEGFAGSKLQTSTGYDDSYAVILSIDLGAGNEDLGVGTTSVGDRTTYFNDSAITMNSGCVIKGFGFHYPNQNMLETDTVTTPPTKYSPAITIAYQSEGTTIQNINIGNCYVGIDARKEHNACHIENIFGSPLSIGIRTGSTTGFDYIEKVNFILGNAYKDPEFPTASMILWVGTNAIGIEQNRATWIKFSSVYIFGYNTGINIFASAADATNGLTQTASGQTCSYVGCGFDFCAYGIKGTDVFYLSISDCNFTPKHKDQTLLADTYAVYLDNAGTSAYNIRVTNCSVHDADMTSFYFKDVNNLVVSGCQTEEFGILKSGHGIYVENCDQTVITGNTLNGGSNTNTSIGIRIKSSDSCVISDNVLAGIDSYPIEIDTAVNSQVCNNIGRNNTLGLIHDNSASNQYSNKITDNLDTVVSPDTDDADVDGSDILQVPIGTEFISHSGIGDVSGITHGQKGQIITIRFAAIAATNGFVDEDAGVNQENRLYMNSNFGYNFGDVIQFVSRGSLGWYEVSRSVN